MRSRLSFLLVLVWAAVAVYQFTGCGGGDTPSDKARKEVNRTAEQFQPYIPKNHVELDNYNRAQRLADDPSTILWCTAFPSAPGAPFITVPIAGKLTSSTTTFFQPEAAIDVHGDGASAIGLGTARSVDGLFHPNPPKYRFGFTPGGEYVSFEEGMPVICSTKPLAFERQEILVGTDPGLSAADSKAQDALRNGNSAEAEQILKDAAP